MEAFATPYPVYFQDEDGEPKPCGHIGVHSVLTFKRFQAIMSQKTNLPANQLSAVFVCRRMVRGLRRAAALAPHWQGAISYVGWRRRRRLGGD